MTDSGRGIRVPATWWPAMLATAYAVAFVLVYVVSVRTEQGRLVSDAALRGAIASGSPIRDTVDSVLDVVSVGSLLGAVAVVAVIALLRLDRIRGLAAIGLLVVANVVSRVLKSYVLERPDLGLDEIGPATLNSLPSGHATAAFSAVTALLIVLPPAWHAATALAGGGFATVIALATMFAGWHRTADAMASFLVVGVCTMVALSVVAAYAEPRPHASAPVGLRWWLVVSGASLAIGAALGGGLSTLAPVRDSLAGGLLAFLSAGLLIIGTVLAVLAGILWVLGVNEAEGGRPDDRVRLSG
ncbi:phosphatase PAP2 family protein [Nocardioides seonyuensis]|uniref:Phosphatase PAP2 family protein n=1 Tax=Nocardioides seonyuensis TaxID=2518371 RepID=A0A4P7II30_9ACTN|nr:phosphatase PAP2 family protein [Nocardioides seonyuensis]QBX55511.1 phosphatase PAP2 family protein [Nocardioides seonyuensis]